MVCGGQCAALQLHCSSIFQWNKPHVQWNKMSQNPTFTGLDATESNLIPNSLAKFY